MTILFIFLGKLISFISQRLGIGGGETWPGHIALLLDKSFIKKVLQKSGTKVVLVIGTNGKTTTSKMAQWILEKNGLKVFRNKTGANLLNGVASTLLRKASLSGKINFDYAIFEIDENTVSLILKEVEPEYIIVLNIFRDQLDRYGEVNTISKKWREAFSKLKERTTLILNSDDPQVSYLGKKQKTFYFGIDKKSLGKKETEHASDSHYCPNCNSKLNFEVIYFSHLGIWECPGCGIKRPKTEISDFSFYPMIGTYNIYNTLGAVLLARKIGISDKRIAKALKDFRPAFGRQEEVEFEGKKIKIFLSKNPASLNESLRTIEFLGATNILMILNNRIPDGRDVSWIWDVDFEKHVKRFKNINISGDRVYDLALRLKYSGLLEKEFETFESLEEGLKNSLKKLPTKQILYVVPTYSAMLETREIITGKKIL